MPYKDIKENDINKNPDKEPSVLLEEIPDDAPEYVKAVIMTMIMTKYALKDHANLS